MMDLVEDAVMKKAKLIHNNKLIKEKILKISKRLLDEKLNDKKNLLKQIKKQKEFFEKEERKILDFYEKEKNKARERKDWEYYNELCDDEEEAFLSLYNNTIFDYDIYLDKLDTEIDILQYVLNSRLSTIEDIREFIYELNNNEDLLSLFHIYL